MRFHNRQKSCETVSVVVDNARIEKLEDLKYLEIQLDQNLNWKTRCLSLLSKLGSMTYLFHNTKTMLS